MNRRNILTASLVLPMALSCTDSVACSLAIIDHTDLGRANDAVRGLFRAWWDRDLSAFKAHFTDLRMDNGELMEAALAKELVANSGITEDSFRIFERFFVNKKYDKAISYVLSTPIGVLIGCVEDSGKKTGGGSCDFLPTQHIFLVKMSGLNPIEIKHVTSEETAYPNLAAFSMER